MNTPIVILHGWGLSAASYMPLLRELRRNHKKVFAPDFPGFDSIDVPKRAYTLEDYVSFLHNYLSKHNIKYPIFIAHSFGGRVALRYQALYPDAVKALILTGTPGFTPVAKRKLVLYILLAKIGGMFFSFPLLNRMKNRIRNWYYYLVGARDFYRARGVMQETFKNIVQESLLDNMKKVHVPTLLIWGEHDIIVPISIAKKMQTTIPKAKLVILQGKSHSVLFDDAKLFVSHVLPWIERL